MLEHLMISNFAIIEDLEVDFTSGFLALSGETGAGKSIIIDALSMLLGERSSFDKIRYGKNRAFIEGVFSLTEDKKAIVEDTLNDSLEDDNLIVSRILDVNGKSICKINNATVTLSTLKAITSLLIDIHSQQKDANYLNQKNQLNLLDRYIKNVCKKNEKEAFEKLNLEYNKYKQLKCEKESLLERQNSLGSYDYLSYAVNELEKADIKPNEMEDLEEEKEKLAEFARSSEKLIAFIDDYKNASSYLYNAKKSLSYLHDEEFSSLSDQFTEQYFAIEDTFDEINKKFESYQDSLERLNEINDRLYFLHSLRKKYGYTTEDILAKFEELKNDLDLIDSFEAKLAKIEKDIQSQTSVLLNASNVITKIRKEYAEVLSKDVNSQLKDLYLENSEFKAEISPIDEFNHNGLDDVCFLLKANAGGSFLPLDKSASLGETSRLNLALKTVFNKIDPKPTIIFDEIDIGISGRVGSAVAKKMKKISESSQVIAISHLPQVCACAEHHYFVSKEVKDGATYSSIKLLSEDERINEIAKMIANEKVNETSIKASKELIESFK